MIRSFRVFVQTDAALFQKVHFALAARQEAGMGRARSKDIVVCGGIKLQLQVFAKPTGIVIASSLGIAKGFQEGIRVQDALDNDRVVLLFRVVACCFRTTTVLALLDTGQISQ